MCSKHTHTNTHKPTISNQCTPLWTSWQPPEMFSSCQIPTVIIRQQRTRQNNNHRIRNLGYVKTVRSCLGCIFQPFLCSAFTEFLMERWCNFWTIWSLCHRATVTWFSVFGGTDEEFKQKIKFTDLFVSDWWRHKNAFFSFTDYFLIIYDILIDQILDCKS